MRRAGWDPGVLALHCLAHFLIPVYLLLILLRFAPLAVLNGLGLFPLVHHGVQLTRELKLLSQVLHIPLIKSWAARDLVVGWFQQDFKLLREFVVFELNSNWI